MRKRYTNYETPHEWYYNKHPGCTDRRGSENLFFEGDTIYSFGEHFAIAKKYGCCVLFNTDTYSPTTGRHYSLVSTAIPAEMPVIRVDNPEARFKSGHKENYKRKVKALDQLLEEIAKGRAGYTQDYRIASLKREIKELNLYTKLFKLGFRQKFISNYLDDEYLAGLKEASKKRAAAKKKKKAKEQAILERKNAGDITEWKLNLVNTPLSLSYHIKKTYLRIREGRVETSKGANLEIKHALLLWHYINRIKEGKSEFKPRHFGSFNLTNVKQNGDITIGCHHITYEEMEWAYGEIQLQ